MHYNGVGWVDKPNVSDGLWACWVFNPTSPLCHFLMHSTIVRQGEATKLGYFFGLVLFCKWLKSTQPALLCASVFGLAANQASTHSTNISATNTAIASDHEPKWSYSTPIPKGPSTAIK